MPRARGNDRNRRMMLIQGTQNRSRLQAIEDRHLVIGEDEVREVRAALVAAGLLDRAAT